MGQVWVKSKEYVEEQAQTSVKDRLSFSTQIFMDEKARSLGYDNILNLCTYATSTNKRFAKEGRAGLKWRDSVWTLVHKIMEDVLAGKREAPTRQEIISELPDIVWPE